MAFFKPENIRNIGILAHVDAGKTTLTEQLLYKSGAIRQAGDVNSGTTQTDFLPIERERGITVRASQISLVHNGILINLIDTPGHMDFTGEVERSLPALDAAVLVVSAVEGIQSHTENLWRAMERVGLPVLVFINKLDRAGSRAEELTEAIRTELNANILALQTVKGEETKECAVQTPDDIGERITEVCADFDDGIADAYLSGETPEPGILTAVLRRCVAKRKIIPVLYGAAQLGVGVKELLQAVCELLPSPAETGDAETDAPPAAQVFRIEHDKTMGKIAHVRMYAGSLVSRDAVTVIHPGQAGMRLENTVPDEEAAPVEKISQVRKCNGQRYMDVGEVHAGDIAALCGLSSAKVGDIIGELGEKHRKDYRIAGAFLQVRAAPKEPAELIPLVNALKELAEEDPLIDCRWEKTEREILVSITGEIQLEVLSALLKERYGLEAVFSPPSVIYKETPSKAGDGFDAYTMPKPCWAIVGFRFEPLARGAGVVYDGGHIPSNTCFYRYQNHIRQSFFRSLGQGMLGWEVTDFRATLTCAEHHTIHTHPLDFFVCTPMAVMDGLRNTGTTLLEPFLKMRITAGREYLGKLIAEIGTMRGSFDDPVIREERMTLEAAVPAATSLDFPVRLAAMTGGKAVLSVSFDGYRDVPTELGRICPRRGINPLDRAKWILQARGAIQGELL